MLYYTKYFMKCLKKTTYSGADTQQSEWLFNFDEFK